MEQRTPRLGNTVRCMLTGLTGIAFQAVQLATGTMQFAVQPKLAGDAPIAGGIPDAVNIDVQLLEYVDDGVADRVITPAPCAIPLGSEVTDVATGIVGMVTSSCTFINGCVYFYVQPKQTAKQQLDGTIPELQFISSTRLVRVGAGFSKHVEPELEKPISQRTGGPTTLAARI